MRISIICPTYDRPDKHRNLYTVFAHQTYLDKELLVLDDSQEESPFFATLQDPRVIYRHLPNRATIGEKRNQLIDMAKGEIIAHFDDDDYYAPTYLETMIQPIGEAADFAKLSKWYTWQEKGGNLWEWDTCSVGEFRVTGKGEVLPWIIPEYAKKLAAFTEAKLAKLWGFGFTYIYKKSLWKDVLFEDRNHGEDYAFIKKAKSMGKICLYSSDYPHLVLHTLHAQGSSYIYPQERLEPSEALKIFGEAVKPFLKVER